MAKEAFQRKRNIICGPLEKELRKMLVKCFVWNIASYGAETWTLRRNERKRLEALEMLIIWRRMERVQLTDKIKNAVVLERVEEGRIKLELIKRKINWLGHWLGRNCLLKNALEGMVNRKKFQGRRRYQMMGNIMINGQTN